MKNTLLSAVCLMAVSTSASFAQNPFMGTTVNHPYQDDVSSDKAIVIYANSNGSDHANEFIYFKVYAPGGGSDWANYDWYSNPTAWMDPSTFHFSNLNLKMYKNNIQINKGGVLEFGADQVKEANAGKIGYGLFTPGLNIIGGNTVPNSRASADRRLIVFAEGGSIFNGPVGIQTHGDGSMKLPSTLSNGADLSNYKLFVAGGILAKEVRVNSTWADYVFAPEYKLKSLAEVEKQINKLGHLPGMPSAKEIETDGFSVGEIARLQQEKIEELTLYVIALKKEIDQLKAKSIVQK